MAYVCSARTVGQESTLEEHLEHFMYLVCRMSVSEVASRARHRASQVRASFVCGWPSRRLGVRGRRIAGTRADTRARPAPDRARPRPASGRLAFTFRVLDTSSWRTIVLRPITHNNRSARSSQGGALRDCCTTTRSLVGTRDRILHAACRKIQRAAPLTLPPTSHAPRKFTELPLQLSHTMHTEATVRALSSSLFVLSHPALGPWLPSGPHKKRQALPAPSRQPHNSHMAPRAVTHAPVLLSS